MTSTRALALNGMLEAYGRAANVSVANPNGICCDGCGFINRSRATLSTGRPELGATASASRDFSENADLYDQPGGDLIVPVIIATSLTIIILAPAAI
nr:filamentous hemagglutinin N-terminal domain-containing protein [Mesorhizobium alhagi]